MRELIHSLFRNSISFIGAALTTASGVVLVALLGMEWLGFEGGPYLGLVTFLALPALFVLGLALIPIGLARHRRRRHTRDPNTPEFPVIDFNRPRVRTIALGGVVLTACNALLISVATYKGVRVVHSTEFCGGTCHSVMSPEYTAYQASVHSAVPCVSCHVGEGAEHFVRSKMQGTRQLFALMTNTYARPVPAPIRNQRSAYETCGECHDPKRYVGDRLRILRKYGDDEANTEKVSVLMMKVGGLHGGKWSGNHWHADPATKIRYLGDAQHKTIHTVEVVRADGTTRRYKTQDAPEPPKDARWHAMDCTDCHNRVGHEFRSAEREVDDALAEKRISRELPFVRKEAVRLLTASYPSAEDGQQEIAKGLREVYAKDHPEVAKAKSAELDAAAAELGRIFSRNVFPRMKVGFGTYPNHLGHEGGCFRCHDNEHIAENDLRISKKCETCHQALATDEQDPEALQVLYP
jgi:nitrate/TMAO reductase-like tetraheme cytochrome c subunit